jgi:hypothetical protein
MENLRILLIINYIRESYVLEKLLDFIIKIIIINSYNM